MNFSVIVPFNNSFELMTNFLENLIRTTNFDFGELVLISDDCRDLRAINYIRAKAEEHQWLQLLELHQPVGCARANNIGVQHSKGNVLVFLNSDVFPTVGAVNKLVEYVIRHQPEVGAAQGMLIYPQTNLVQSTGHLFMGYYNGHIYSGCSPADPLVQKNGSRQAITSAFAAIPRNVFESMGEFDEAYYNAYEGLELTLRISLNGRTCMYYAEAVAFHAVGGSRSHMHYDDSLPGHIFWHRWKDQICNDLHTYLAPQITAQMRNEVYFLLQGSSIPGWQEVLQELGLRTSECFDLPSRFSRGIDLYQDLPRMALDSPCPYIFTVDALAYIKGNHNWAELRNNPLDIVMDAHGLVCPFAAAVGIE